MYEHPPPLHSCHVCFNHSSPHVAFVFFDSTTRWKNWQLHFFIIQKANQLRFFLNYMIRKRWNAIRYLLPYLYLRFLWLFFLSLFEYIVIITISSHAFDLSVILTTSLFRLLIIFRCEAVSLWSDCSFCFFI